MIVVGNWIVLIYLVVGAYCSVSCSRQAWATLLSGLQGYRPSNQKKKNPVLCGSMTPFSQNQQFCQGRPRAPGSTASISGLQSTNDLSLKPCLKTAKWIRLHERILFHFHGNSSYLFLGPYNGIPCYWRFRIQQFWAGVNIVPVTSYFQKIAQLPQIFLRLRYNFVAVDIDNFEFSTLVQFLCRFYISKIWSYDVVQFIGVVYLEDKSKQTKVLWINLWVLHTIIV